MTLTLPWRDVAIDGGKPIATSLTGAEASVLAKLAVGKSVLEIGSAYGYSAILMALAGAKSVVAVDPHAGHGAMPDSLSIMRENLLSYGVEDRVRIVPSTSRSWEDPEGHYDLVFIDGDHRRESVERDLVLAVGVLVQGGTVACHDYGESTCPGVKEAIDSLGDLGAKTLVDTLWVWTPDSV
jgi:predicted O-methyltransferase YrrM